MKRRYIIGGVIILVFLAYGTWSALNTSIEYATISAAERSGKEVQITGRWVQEKGSAYDPATNTFTFYMKDGDQRVAKVILAKGKPNNFDIATSIVARGRFRDGSFHASEVLTKCPSKYEGSPASEHPGDIPRTSI
jgi:cytochrome c-type biogenesis protein CcmE